VGIVRTCLIVMTSLAVGCSPAPPAPTPVPSGFIDLPTLSGVAPDTGGALLACAGVGFSDSVLHGSQTAADKVWLEAVDPFVSVGVAAVRWPAGFRARFAPTLELLDSIGVVVAREGDLLTTIGGTHEPDGRFAIWEFDGHSYDCY
jgi:hypothetical protein